MVIIKIIIIFIQESKPLIKSTIGSYDTLTDSFKSSFSGGGAVYYPLQEFTNFYFEFTLNNNLFNFKSIKELNISIMKYKDVNYPSLNYSYNNYPGQNNPAFKFIILYNDGGNCLSILSTVTILGGYTIVNTYSGDLESVESNVRCFKIYLKKFNLYTSNTYCIKY